MTLSRRQLLVTGSVAVLGSQLLPRRLAGQAVAAPPKGTFTELRGGVGIFTARGRNDRLAGDARRRAGGRQSVAGDRTGLSRGFPLPYGTTCRGADQHPPPRRSHRRQRRPRLRRLDRGARQRPGAATSLGRAGRRRRPRVVADTTFTDAWRMDLGSEAVAARHYGPAHTGGDIAVHFEKADVVHLGDLVFNRIYPFIDRSAGASIRSWITVLEKIAAAHGESTRFVYGHGKRESGVTRREGRPPSAARLLHCAAGARGQELKAGRSVEEIAGATSLAGFPEHVSPIPFLSLGNCLRVAGAEAPPEVSQGSAGAPVVPRCAPRLPGVRRSGLDAIARLGAIRRVGRPFGSAPFDVRHQAVPQSAGRHVERVLARQHAAAAAAEP